MKKYQWLISTILALSLVGLPAMTASAAPDPGAAAIELTAISPNPVQVDDIFSFELVLAANEVTAGVGGVDIYLAYDPTLATASSLAGQPPAEILPDFFGAGNVASINELLAAGQCPGTADPCIHLVLAGPPQVTQTGVAARFTFQAAAAGEACFSVVQAAVVDADGQPVSYTTSDPQCVTIESGSIKGTVLRQGTPANPNAGAGSLACTVLTAAGVASTEVFTDTDGNFTFNEPAADTYTLSASYPGYLSAEKSGVVVASSADKLEVGSVTLRGGDVNGDKFINILDIGTIISKFGQAGLAVRSAGVDCTGADEITDINDDGLVNISDLAITAGNWGSVGPTLWP